MRDQRADALAQILVQYSTRVQKGDVCVIQATSTIAEPPQKSRPRRPQWFTITTGRP